ncbi:MULTISPECIES: hypothetical protein [unclassified Amycolatopsis]|uniref:hypothetical protein n=1 Tax=unclassified Amycolatopsis TaxID=2618356 RepID=UPI00287681B0|nr:MULTISPECIES: hypothetical protein [unclassified Amycolatopsis]MDS0134664.1 hypothetical protein [Amycolatopsis sp. 505]MDS0147437.1 hypothetical protein [Amycolatopsis sp. CM201R]
MVHSRIPAEEAKNLRFERGTIDALWPSAESQHLADIEQFEDIGINQLIALGSLFERPHEIQRTLHKLGVPVPAVPTTVTTRSSSTLSRPG